ncbi:MFS transporter [Herbiconiux solani]|uniref:MFS transporter n=1 Tax=Herbiconiux solani TaxID=661329 RepID=UPI000827162E|nr:MFS transporter [Herbiconiux solani]
MKGTRRNGWFGVIAVAVGSFGTVLSEFLPIGLLPSISADLGVSIGVAGLMVVVTGLAAAVAAPVVTVATSLLDRRVVLIGLSAVLVLADVVAATAVVFPVLLVARILLGVALGGFWAVGLGVAPRLVAAKDTIKATSLVTAGISIATVVSLPLGAFVAATSTWRLAFVIGAALGAIALVLQLIALPAIPTEKRIRASSLTTLFTVPRARLGLIVAAFLFAAQFAAYTYISSFLQDTAMISPDAVSVALLVFGISGIVGNFAAGALLNRTIVGTLVASGLLLAGAVALLPLIAHLPVAVFALLIVWGLVWGGLPLGLQTWMATASPEGAEAGLAMFVTTIQVALAVGSTLGGIAVTVSGIGSDFGFAAILALLGTAVLILLGRRAAQARPAVAAAQA